MSSAARLRNLLVHRYWDIDDQRVYEIAGKGLKDFKEREAFRDVDVAIWLSNPEEAWFYIVDEFVRLGGVLEIPVDIQVLNNAPLPLQHHVYTEGVLLSRDGKSGQR